MPSTETAAVPIFELNTSASESAQPVFLQSAGATEIRSFVSRATSLGRIFGQEWLTLGSYAGPSDAFRAFEPVFMKIGALTGLQPGWDDNSGEPPSREVIGIAQRLLLEVIQRFGPEHRRDILPSAIAPIPGGGIYLEWRGAHVEFQVDILPGGQRGYLFVDRRGCPARYEEGDEATDELILSYLDRVLGANG